MRLVSPTQEKLAIRSLLSTNRYVSSLLFSSLDDTHFAYPPAQELLKNIRKNAIRDGKMPKWHDVIEDPSISENVRKLFAAFTKKPLRSRSRAKDLIKKLDDFRFARVSYHLAEDIATSLKQDKLDRHALQKRMLDGVTAANSSSNHADSFFTHGSNTDEDQKTIKLQKQILKGQKLRFIPTGFKGFDDVNVGIPIGSYMTLAATSGGGKCLHPDTLIATSEGDFTLKQLWEMAEEDNGKNSNYVDQYINFSRPLTVLTASLRPKRITHVYRTIGLLIQVKFSNGAVISGLKEHKIWVLDKTGKPIFCRLDELKPGHTTPRFESLSKLEQKFWSWHELGDKRYGITQMLRVEQVTALHENVVYDLHVEDDHSYLLSCGIMSHNTAMGLQLCQNMAERGARVCFVSMEMEAEEIELRHMANIASVSMSKLIKPKSISNTEASEILKKCRDWRKTVKSRDGVLTFFCPQEDISLEETLFLLKPYSYDVIALDYLGLFKGMDGDNQWQKMSAGARFGKRFASINKTIVIGLAQLSADGELRYSKGVVEHSSSMWTWIYNEEAKNSHILPISQPKARNQTAHTFLLTENFEKMQIMDFEGEDLRKNTGKHAGKKIKNDQLNGKSEDDYLDI